MVFSQKKKKLLVNDLESLSKLNSSIVFFISPKKINRVIPHFQKNFSGRKILICREMTKYFEEFIRLDVDELDKIQLDFKGELTIVISEKKIEKKSSTNLNESDKILINQMINKLSIKEITILINREKKISKKEIYNYCIKLKNES